MANWVMWCILGEVSFKIIACVGAQIRHNRASNVVFATALLVLPGKPSLPDLKRQKKRSRSKDDANL